MRTQKPVAMSPRIPKESQSEFVRHTHCNACGSSDANGVFDDGHTFCFSCNTYTEGEEPGGEGDDTGPAKVRNKGATQQAGLLKGKPEAIPARGLNHETCKKFGYLVGQHKGQL